MNRTKCRRANSFAKVAIRTLTRSGLHSLGICCELLLLNLVFTHDAEAQYRTADQYYHAVFSSREGAPPDVRAIVQTSDGFLWLAGSQGLYRFDGIRFLRFDSKPPSGLLHDDINTLCATTDGGVWIAYFHGDASFLKDGTYRHYGEKQGLPANPIMSCAQDIAGRTWALTAAGDLFQLVSDRWSEVPVKWPDGNLPTGLFPDRKGQLWLWANHRLYAFDQGRTVAESSIAAKEVVAVDDGRNSFLLQWKVPGIAPYSVDEYVRDVEGTYWGIADDGSLIHSAQFDGLLTTKPSPAETLRVDHLSGKARLLFTDREGNVWCVTTNGLDQLRRSAVVPLQFPVGMYKYSLAQRDGGGVWVATYFGGEKGTLAEVADGRIKTTRPLSHPVSAYRDLGGVIWFSTVDKGNIVRLASGKTSALTTPSSAVGNTTMDRKGRLYALLQGKGSVRYEEGEWRTSMSSLGAPLHDGLSSFSDAIGNVWFGYKRDRVWKLAEAGEGREAQLFTSANGLHVGDVTTIQGDDHGLWIAGEHGIQALIGQAFRTLIAVDNLDFVDVKGVICAGRDGLWFAERRGIVQVPESEINQFLQDPGHRVRYRLYDRLDGLTEVLQPNYPSPSAVRDRDGLLWFATQNGVAWIDPSHVPKNNVQPSIVLESPLVANGKSIDTTQLERLTLPAHTSDLQIGYTSPSLTMPERVHFRYRLVGLNPEWTEAGPRRVAYFTSLTPGSYTFEVQACNEDELCSSQIGSLSFSINAATYQTWWFRGCCAVLLGAVLWLLYLQRLHVATEQASRRLLAQMAERERIARELHDTLLQGFQGLMLRFQAVLGTLPPKERSYNMLESALVRADEVLTEGRLSVRDLRNEGDAATLEEELVKCARELETDFPIAVELIISGTQRPLNPIILREAYRIGREALFNAFHHAEASQIKILTTYSNSGLTVTISDNGKGIEPLVLKQGRTGHWGLAGMRERAKSMGANTRVTSTLENGTKVELVIPAAVAFVTGPVSRGTFFAKLLARFKRRNNDQD